MSLNSYGNFEAAIADQLARTDLGSQITDCITLFEAEAAYELFRQRGNETRTILVPTNPSPITITGAANNGSGLIRLALSPGYLGPPALTTGSFVNVSQVGGTTEADGTWIITTVGDGIHIDLQNSVFVNAYTSGGVAQGDQGFVALPSNYMGWIRVTWTGNPTVNLDYVAPAQWSTEFPTWLPIADSDTPRVFTIEAGILKIRPVDISPLEFVYYATTPALQSGLNWLFTNRVDAYWYGVLEQAMVYTKDEQRAQEYNQRKTAIYQQIKDQRFRERNNLGIRLDRSSYGGTP